MSYPVTVLHAEQERRVLPARKSFHLEMVVEKVLRRHCLLRQGIPVMLMRSKRGFESGVGVREDTFLQSW